MKSKKVSIRVLVPVMISASIAVCVISCMILFSSYFSISVYSLFASKCIDWIQISRFHRWKQTKYHTDYCRKQYCNHN